MARRPLRRPPARLYQQAAQLLRDAQYVVALTGAGISTPSGIPDFRSGRTGMWNRANPMEVASLWSFHEHPERFYDWYRPLLRQSQRARPNGAHAALARFEAAGLLRAVITQNVDSLHQGAGSQRVLELHGHTRTATCLDCGEQSCCDTLLRAVLDRVEPVRCRCGGLVKPDLVLFGEPLPHDTLVEAQQEALACDVMIVVGTSLEVMPAADLPLLAKRRGARLILVNRTPTPLDDAMDVVICDDVVRALNWLCRAVCP